MQPLPQVSAVVNQRTIYVRVGVVPQTRIKSCGMGGAAGMIKAQRGWLPQRINARTRGQRMRVLSGRMLPWINAREGGGESKKQPSTKGRKLPTKRNRSPSPSVDAGLGVIDTSGNDYAGASGGEDASAAVAGAAGVLGGDASAAVGLWFERCSSTSHRCPVYVVFFQAMQLHASAACDMQPLQRSCASSLPIGSS